MIELEYKYKLIKIPEELSYLSIKKITKQNDIYYDTADYSLIKKGNFLRIRNNDKIDFKIDIGDDTHLYCKETSFKVSEICKRINDINKVLLSVGLPKSKSILKNENFLLENNFIELARINKIRTIYELDENCNLCIDEVDNLGLFLEAEVIINSNDINQIKAEKIKSGLEKRLIENKFIDSSSERINTGYVELYLLMYNPNVYELGKFKI